MTIRSMGQLLVGTQGCARGTGEAHRQQLTCISRRLLRYLFRRCQQSCNGEGRGGGRAAGRQQSCQPQGDISSSRTTLTSTSWLYAMSKLSLIRNRKFALQGGRCFYCGQPMWLSPDDQSAFAATFGLSIKQSYHLRATAEHLQAKCDGGRDTAENVVAACLYCNMKRHQRAKPQMPGQYRAHVLKRLDRGRWHQLSLSANLKPFPACIAAGVGSVGRSPSPAPPLFPPPHR